jgi:hypothetical protein
MPMPVPAREAGPRDTAASPLADGRKMRYCAPPKERLALGLRRLRAVRGLSQIALAERVGIGHVPLSPLSQFLGQ